MNTAPVGLQQSVGLWERQGQALFNPLVSLRSGWNTGDIESDTMINSVSFLCCFALGPGTQGWPCAVDDRLSAQVKGMDW